MSISYLYLNYLDSDETQQMYYPRFNECRILVLILYEIEEIETSIEAVETRLYNIKQEEVSSDNVYQFLLFFDKLYDRFTDMEKKTFMKSFFAEVNIYEEERRKQHGTQKGKTDVRSLL